MLSLSLSIVVQDVLCFANCSNAAQMHKYNCSNAAQVLKCCTNAAQMLKCQMFQKCTTTHEPNRPTNQPTNQSMLKISKLPLPFFENQLVTRTTADPRPNAYIPSDGLGLPRPYGKFAQFKPTEPGSTMRHIRKPNPKQIEL